MHIPGKPTIQLVCAVIVMTVGCGLLIAGFIVAPMGEIHSSVLVGFGEVMTFAGALLGIDYRYKYRSKNKRTDGGEPPA